MKKFNFQYTKINKLLPLFFKARSNTLFIVTRPCINFGPVFAPYNDAPTSASKSLNACCKCGHFDS